MHAIGRIPLIRGLAVVSFEALQDARHGWYRPPLHRSTRTISIGIPGLLVRAVHIGQRQSFLCGTLVILGDIGIDETGSIRNEN